MLGLFLLESVFVKLPQYLLFHLDLGLVGSKVSRLSLLIIAEGIAYNNCLAKASSGDLDEEK